jgi:hypothetical protein
MAIDYNFIKKNHLEESINRLRKINEYIVNPDGNYEADDPNQQNTDGQTPDMGGDNQMPPMGGQNDMQQQPQMGNDPNGGQAPDMGGDGSMPPMDGQAPDMNGGMPQGGDAPAPDMGGDTSAVDSIGTEVPDEEGDEESDGEDTVGADDEVIDVADLTNSQEAAEYKIDGVDDKLTKLLGMISKFEQAIEANDTKLDDLKSEFEKRNPTNAERINIRSMNSKPFNVNPTEYWDEQRENNPNYDVISDNSVAPNDEEKVYKITDDDLKDFTSGDLEKSFSKFPKDLKDYFEK